MIGLKLQVRVKNKLSICLFLVKKRSVCKCANITKTYNLFVGMVIVYVWLPDVKWRNFLLSLESGSIKRNIVGEGKSYNPVYMGTITIIFLISELFDWKLCCFSESCMAIIMANALVNSSIHSHCTKGCWCHWMPWPHII